MVRPFPKLIRKESRRGRKKGSSRILTNTLEKEELLRQTVEKQNKGKGKAKGKTSNKPKLNLGAPLKARQLKLRQERRFWCLAKRYLSLANLVTKQIRKKRSYSAAHANFITTRDVAQKNFKSTSLIKMTLTYLCVRTALRWTTAMIPQKKYLK